MHEHQALNCMLDCMELLSVMCVSVYVFALPLFPLCSSSHFQEACLSLNVKNAADKEDGPKGY